MKRHGCYCYLVALTMAAVMVPPSTVLADNKSSFIIDVTHSFYVKAMCRGFDIDYEAFVKSARSNELGTEIVEQVRKGVAHLNTNGQTGERGPKDVMASISLAAKMINLDLNTTGVEKWCEHRSKFLLQSGFVKKENIAPTVAALQKRIDEQFAEMRKAMPMQVSRMSTLTNAARAGMTIQYSYANGLPAASWTEEDKQKLTANVIKAQCEGKNTRALLDSGFSMVASHFDKNGMSIVNIYIDKTKCP